MLSKDDINRELLILHIRRALEYFYEGWEESSAIELRVPFKISVDFQAWGLPIPNPCLKVDGFHVTAVDGAKEWATKAVSVQGADAWGSRWTKISAPDGWQTLMDTCDIMEMENNGGCKDEIG